MEVTRRLVLGASGALALPGLLRAQGSAPIRIGEINSYTAQPAFTLPYRNAMQLAVERVNAAGGVLGRPLELITRDDAGRPQDAVRLAGELVNDQKVDVLAGAYLSNVGLALGEYAVQNKRLYVAGEPLTDAMVWEKGNRYTFRLRPEHLHAGLHPGGGGGQAAGEALGHGGAQLRVRPVRREVVQAAPHRPPARTSSSWASNGPRSAASTPAPPCRRWTHARPRAIFNVLFGTDLTNFVRAGQHARPVRAPRRRLAADRRAGIPRPAGRRGAGGLDRHRLSRRDDRHARAPRPSRAPTAPSSTRSPCAAPLVGYALINSIAAGIAKAGSRGDGERWSRASRGVQLRHARRPGRATAPSTIRARWASMSAGRRCGTDAGVMTDWRYVDGTELLPSDEVVRGLRPACAS